MIFLLYLDVIKMLVVNMLQLGTQLLHLAQLLAPSISLHLVTLKAGNEKQYKVLNFKWIVSMLSQFLFRNHIQLILQVTQNGNFYFILSYIISERHDHYKYTSHYSTAHHEWWQRGAQLLWYRKLMLGRGYPLNYIC